MTRIETELESESGGSKGERMKIITPANFIDIWARLEMMLGLKLSRHTDT